MASDTCLSDQQALVWRLLYALVALAPIMMFASPAMADESLNPRGNIKRVIGKIEAVTGEKVVNPLRSEPEDDPTTHCLENRYCEGRIGELRIEAMGRRIDIMPAPSTAPKLLEGSCVGLLTAFATKGTQKEIRAFVRTAIEHVLDDERLEADFGSFKFEMRLTQEDLPSCAVVRFIER